MQHQTNNLQTEQTTILYIGAAGTIFETGQDIRMGEGRVRPKYFHNTLSLQE